MATYISPQQAGTRLGYLMGQHNRHQDQYFSAYIADGIGSAGLWELFYPVASVVAIQAYVEVVGPDDFDWDDWTSWGDGYISTNGNVEIDIPLIPPPLESGSWFDHFVALMINRRSWFAARYAARMLLAKAFGTGTGGHGGILSPTQVRDDPILGDASSMAYGSAGLKNAGKWFRVNEIVRHNARLKTAINADGSVQAQGLIMLNAVKRISESLGLPLSGAEDPGAKSANLFPITKQFWMGYLPISRYDNADPPVDLERTTFLQAAHELRKRVAGIIKAFKLDADAFNTADEANPGGEV